MLCLMQSWTSAKKHWSCFDIMKDQGLSRSHLKHLFSRARDSSVRSEVNRPKVWEQPTSRPTASLWRYPKLRSVRSSCKQSKVVFPNAVLLQSFYPLLKQRSRCCSRRSNRIRSQTAQELPSLARTRAQEKTSQLGLKRALLVVNRGARSHITGALARERSARDKEPQ